MGIRLATNVKVRKESWGLLFYSQSQHRIFFVRSNDWLFPHNFDGTWNAENLTRDISQRTGISAIATERSLDKVIDNLIKNGMIVYGLC